MFSRRLRRQPIRHPTGDMLISVRQLNLVFIVRPSEQKVLWYRYEFTSSQHDASFVDGSVEVFDNNPTSHPPRPRILRLDLNENRAEEVFDLSRWKMAVRELGNFELRGDQLLTVDPDAGRLIAGRLNGDIEFDFENGWRDSDGQIINLQLLNATEIDPDSFKRFQASCGG